MNRAAEYVRDRIARERSAAGILGAYISSNLEFFRDCRTPIIAMVEICFTARDESGRPLYGID